MPDKKKGKYGVSETSNILYELQCPLFDNIPGDAKGEYDVTKSSNAISVTTYLIMLRKNYEFLGV